MSCGLFCCRVVNVPLQYIGKDLLFAGNTILQGAFFIHFLVVNADVMCLLCLVLFMNIGEKGSNFVQECEEILK